MKCQDLMNINLQWIAGDDSVLAAARTMRDQSIGFLLVAADHYPGHAIGVVTDRDLAVRVCAAGRSARMTRVSEIATRDIVTCFELEDLKVAEQKMRDAQKSRLVVVDGLGRAVGVLSLTDILMGDHGGRALKTARGVLAREAGGAHAPIESIKLTASTPEDEEAALRKETIHRGSWGGSMKEFPS